MAWDLARTVLSAPGELIDVPRQVTTADIERMKRLIALVPSPTIALADELRRRYAPDVPEEVVLFLAAEGAFRGERYHLSHEELVRLLAASRRDEPSRERRIRQYLLEVLRQSEPPAESIAHLRWQLDLAMQLANIAALEGDAGDAPVASLAALAAGPLRDEAKAAATTMRTDPRMESAMRRALRNVKSQIPAVVPDSVQTLPPRVVWPGFAGLFIAAVIAVISYASLRPLARGSGDPIPHVLDAYALKSSVNRSGNDELSISPLRRNMPLRAALYVDGKQVYPSVDVSKTVLLAAGHPSAYYQLQAPLTAGNLALSNALWLPARSESKPDPSIEEVIAETLGVDLKRVTPTAKLRADLGATTVDLMGLELALEVSTKVRLAGVGDVPLVTVAEVKSAIKDQGTKWAITVTVLNNGRSIGPVPVTMTSIRGRQSLRRLGTAGSVIFAESGEWLVSCSASGYVIPPRRIHVDGPNPLVVLTATVVAQESAGDKIIVTLKPPLRLSDVAVLGEYGEKIQRSERMLSPTVGEFTVRTREHGKYLVFAQHPMYDSQDPVQSVRITPGLTIKITMPAPARGIVTIEGSAPGMLARLSGLGSTVANGPVLTDIGGGKFELNAHGGTYEIEVQFSAEKSQSAQPWIKTKVIVVNGKSRRATIEKDIPAPGANSASQSRGVLSPNAAELDAAKGRNISPRGTYIIRIYDLSEFEAATRQLRANGFNVDVHPDPDSRRTTNVTDYSVISIGSAVPVDEAVRVIGVARPLMPWLKYVFVQTDSDLDNLIHLSAHRDWIAEKGLRPLSEIDFTLLMSGRLSDAEFFRIVRSFSNSGRESSIKP